MPKLCEFETCRCQATYGEFYGKPLRCKEHKEDYKLVSQLCQEGNCKIQPHYNYEGEAKGRFCVSHKLENMVNIKSKTCEHEGCKIIPCYNYEGETKARFCVSHKLENMMNIRDRTCENEGCKVRPCYNYEGETIGKFCVTHKLANMVNVKDRTCENEGCKVRPNYNYEGETKAKFCDSHKLANMVDVTHKTCKGINCGTRANDKYKGYCAYCFQHLFPNDPLSFQIRSKTKEIAVRDYINANFDGFHHDKPLWTGNCDCTHRRRIDHRKLIGNTLLCIETDEHQHKSYDETDEEIRYDDLFMLHGGKFVYIRFNPDKFKNKYGKSLNPMLYTRLPVLQREIEKQIKRIENEENNELLEIVKLYYNE
jgi:hypothetical protein